METKQVKSKPVKVPLLKKSKYIDPLSDWGFNRPLSLELPNFVKTEAELITDIDKWLYLLKNLSALKKIPAFLNKKIFQRVFKIAEVANLTNEERVMYNASLKSKLDYDGSIAFAEDKAFEKGLEKGLEKGAQAERAKAEEDKRKTARNFKHNGISIEIISNSTGLSIPEVEAL